MYDPFNIFLLVCEIIYCVIALFVVAMMLKSKDKLFRTAFFKIFIAGVTADVISIIANAVLRHLHLNHFGPDEMPYRLCNLFSAITYYCFYFSLLIATINRLTALVSDPAFHKKLWNKIGAFAAGTPWLLAFACMAYRIPIPILVVPLEEGGYQALTADIVSIIANAILRHLHLNPFGPDEMPYRLCNLFSAIT
ncbi:unnamed protein product, partial [Mesorhabditis spiculigera]